MSTNNDVFSNCQPLKHVLTEFGEIRRVRRQDMALTKHKGAKTGLLLELWGTTGYKGLDLGKWLSQPWTHWMTKKINTRIHQASNHISWGWERLYSCPLEALCPFYCFESSSFYCLPGQYPNAFLLLSCPTVSLIYGKYVKWLKDTNFSFPDTDSDISVSPRCTFLYVWGCIRHPWLVRAKLKLWWE